MWQGITWTNANTGHWWIYALLCLDELINGLIISEGFGGFHKDTFLPLSPPGWRGIVVTVRAGEWAGGRVYGRPAGRAAAKLAEPISL